MSETTTTTDAPARIPFEQHAKSKQTPAHLVAGAKQAGGWGEGREVTEAEFDQAIVDVGNICIR